MICIYFYLFQAVTPFNLLTTIETAMEIASVDVRQPDVELVSALDSNVPLELIGDGLCIRHVLIELLSHCVKYTTAGEIKLSVLLARAPTDENDLVTLSFRVSDTSRQTAAARDSDLALAYWYITLFLRNLFLCVCVHHSLVFFSCLFFYTFFYAIFSFFVCP